MWLVRQYVRRVDVGKELSRRILTATTPILCFKNTFCSQSYNFWERCTKLSSIQYTHFIINHSLNILILPHPLSKLNCHKGLNKTHKAIRILAQNAFSNTDCGSQSGQLDKIREEKSTTQQRKPYFIKQENKNIILGAKRLKKKGMPGGSASGRKAGLRWGGLWRVFASDLCRVHTHSPSTLLACFRPKANTTVIFRDIFRLFFLHSCSWFHLQPWTVM